jgi:N-acetylglucosamine kinase-like BadF-type ATPase
MDGGALMMILVSIDGIVVKVGTGSAGITLLHVNAP